jgi:DNA processing protein
LEHPRSRLIDWLRFHLVFLYHPRAGQALLDRHLEPGRIFRLPPAELLAVPEMCPALVRALLDPRGAAKARDELERVLRGGAAIHFRDGPGWPQSLAGLPEMPFLLYGRGSVLPGDSLAVGVVGSRRPSPHGIRQAERFGDGLARLGITVVSGLARGVDAAAHQAALAAGGRTIAVLGSGLGRIYPQEHRELACRISRSGAVVSEFPWDAPPRQFHFPHRNRILSGLSRGVLVVEAGEKSGSLITAGWAMEQDREVFALPGRVDAPEARGALRLIQDGARLVLDPGEIAEVLGVATRELPRRGPTSTDAGRALPAHLEPLFAEEDAWHADRIIDRLGRPPGEVLAELSMLEANGLLARLPGGAYRRG